MKVKSLSCVRLLATPWTAAHQAPPSMGLSRQEYWSGVPLPSPIIPHRIYQILSCPSSHFESHNHLKELLFHLRNEETEAQVSADSSPLPYCFPLPATVLFSLAFPRRLLFSSKYSKNQILKYLLHSLSS